MDLKTVEGQRPVPILSRRSWMGHNRIIGEDYGALYIAHIASCLLSSSLATNGKLDDVELRPPGTAQTHCKIYFASTHQIFHTFNQKAFLLTSEPPFLSLSQLFNRARNQTSTYPTSTYPEPFLFPHDTFQALYAGPSQSARLDHQAVIPWSA